MPSRAAGAHAAARLYFEENLSQAAIAQRLSVSPSAVSPPITEARRLGTVRIEIRIVTRSFDLRGRPVAYPEEKPLLAVTPEQLRAARTVIGVATGENKHGAIVGAARAKLIDVLVTDMSTAGAALEPASAMG